MADDGRLYSIYTPDMVVAMRQLVSKGSHRKAKLHGGLLLIRYSILYKILLAMMNCVIVAKDCTKWGLTWLS